MRVTSRAQHFEGELLPQPSGASLNVPFRAGFQAPSGALGPTRRADSDCWLFGRGEGRRSQGLGGDRSTAPRVRIFLIHFLIALFHIGRLRLLASVSRLRLCLCLSLPPPASDRSSRPYLSTVLGTAPAAPWPRAPRCRPGFPPPTPHPIPPRRGVSPPGAWPRWRRRRMIFGAAG